MFGWFAGVGHKIGQLSGMVHCALVARPFSVPALSSQMCACGTASSPTRLMAHRDENCRSRNCQTTRSYKFLLLKNAGCVFNARIVEHARTGEVLWVLPCGVPCPGRRVGWAASWGGPSGKPPLLPGSPRAAGSAQTSCPATQNNLSELQFTRMHACSYQLIFILHGRQACTG